MNGIQYNVDIAVPSENWDDDFEFQQTASVASSAAFVTDRFHGVPQSNLPAERAILRMSSASSRFSEDWDAEMLVSPLSQDALSEIPNADSALSSSLRAAAQSVPPFRSTLREIQGSALDDDFNITTPRAYSHRQRSSIPEQLIKAAADADTKRDDDSNLVYADHARASPSKRRKHPGNSSSQSSDADLDLEMLASSEECDEILISSDLACHTRPPPISTCYTMDPAPFPGSPTISLFSNAQSSATGRESAPHLHSSTTYLGSLAGQSNGFPSLPQTMHRERRRLRKKSRPPHLEENICELDDRSFSSVPIPTSEPSDTAPEALSAAVQSLHAAAPKTPLLSRIGSLRNWATRRSRANSGPAATKLSEVSDANLGASSHDPVFELETSGEASLSRADSRQTRTGESACSPEMGVVHTRASPDHVFVPTSDKADKVKRKTSGFFGRGRRVAELDVAKSAPIQASMTRTSSGVTHANDAPGFSLSLPDAGLRVLRGPRRISFGAAKKHWRTKSSADRPDMTALTLSQSVPGNLSAPLDRPATAVSDPHGSITLAPSPAPHSASLGRATVSHAIVSASSPTRRNSLGNLKIPEHIIQAQNGLKRDLSVVKEFAAHVQQLRDLHAKYRLLIGDLRTMVDGHRSQQHPTVSSHLFRPLHGTRKRSNTSPLSNAQCPWKSVPTAADTIESKYKVSWECAELLIELGGSGHGPPRSSVSVPIIPPNLQINAVNDGGTAETFAPSGNAVRTSCIPTSAHLVSGAQASPGDATVRHELSHRQLELLQEILGSRMYGIADPDGRDLKKYGVLNKEWRWGHDINSTVTLPGGQPSTSEVSNTKEGADRHLRMKGLRDMLRVVQTYLMSRVVEDTCASESPDEHHHRWLHPRFPTQRRRRSNASRDEPAVPVDGAARPFPPVPVEVHRRPSSRRASIAHVFRIGTRRRFAADALSPVLSAAGSATTSSGMGLDDEWDKLDDANDPDDTPKLEVPVAGTMSLAGSREGDQGSLGQAPRISTEAETDHGHGFPGLVMSDSSDHASDRSARSFAVQENLNLPPVFSPLNRRMVGGPGASGGKQGQTMNSVWSAPPVTMANVSSPAALMLALTPDDVGSLLENAKEVCYQCSECISEMMHLIQNR